MFLQQYKWRHNNRHKGPLFQLNNHWNSSYHISSERLSGKATSRVSPGASVSRRPVQPVNTEQRQTSFHFRILFRGSCAVLELCHCLKLRAREAGEKMTVVEGRENPAPPIPPPKPLPPLLYSPSRGNNDPGACGVYRVSTSSLVCVSVCVSRPRFCQAPRAHSCMINRRHIITWRCRQPLCLSTASVHAHASSRAPISRVTRFHRI